MSMIGPFVSGLQARVGASASRELVLLLATMLWAGTLFVVQSALAHCGPLFFVGLRFVSAALLVALVCRRAMRGWRFKEIWAGTLVGVTIFLAYALQTTGLKTISASQSAFITSMYVPGVPLLQWLMFGHRPHAMSWLGIGLAFAGLVTLTNPDPGNLVGMGTGELLSLMGAAAIAVEIVLISRFAAGVNLERITVVQLLSAGLLAWVAMPVLGEPLPGGEGAWLFSGLAMGVVSAMVQLAMNWAQKDVSPTRATLIYASGPIWGGVFGWVMGVSLTLSAVVGAALIAVGMVLSEWRPGGKRTSG